MKLETFFEKFDLFAGAPDAVAKLRELVLDLAVHGQLVEQSADDEPAQELLRKSRGAMSKLMAEGKAKKEKPADPVADDETTFPLPNGWAWGRLVDAAQFINGLAFKPSDWGNVGRPIIRIQNLSGRNPDYNRTTGTYDPSVVVQDGDILVSWSATLDAFVWRGEEGVLNQHIFRVLPAPMADKGYLFWLLKWVIRQLAESDHAHGLVMSHINRGPFLARSIPLPPLAEQKRIVAKVDELMALCDRLEAQQQEGEIRRGELARASLARFADAPTPANLDFLFHKSYAIPPADLRKSILTLAVQGKLVPQDPNDEPALALLDRISAHKSALAKEGKLRGSTSVAPMAADDGDYDPPASWTWVRFGEIMINRDGERIPVSKEERETKAKSYDYYGASGVIDKIDNYLFDKPLLLIGEDGANLINRSTPIAFIARGKYWVNNHAHVLDGISEEFLQFIELHINAINLERYITGSAQPKMNQAKMNSIPIALPPLAEQRRIVAKVDDLMALVAALETQLATARSTATALLAAAVAELDKLA